MILRRLASSCLAVMAMIATTLLAFGGTSSATEAKSDRVFLMIQNIGSGNGCLDLRSYANGTPATLALCDSSVGSQWWEYEPAGTLRNTGSGNGCLDLGSYTNGSPAILARCDMNAQSQKWDFESTGNTIRNVGSGNGCLDLRSYANGSPAILNRCALNVASQQWYP